jgi:hypothetical protein
MNDEEMQSCVSTMFDRSGLLFNLWNITPLKSLTLTNVGTVIAHANVRRKTKQDIDLTIWIKD